MMKLPNQSLGFLFGPRAPLSFRHMMIVILNFSYA